MLNYIARCSIDLFKCTISFSSRICPYELLHSFQRYAITWWNLSGICSRYVVFSGYSTNKIHRHDISEILLKVALNIIPLPPHFRVQIILSIEHHTMNTRYEVIKRFITKYKDAQRARADEWWSLLTFRHQV